MSKERDQKVFNALKEICTNTFNRPTEFSEQRLEEITGTSVLEISHSLNNLQRDGLIRIHIGATENLSKVELLKSPLSS